jgi:hypothetical protein
MRGLQERPQDENGDGAQQMLAMGGVEKQLRQLEADQVSSKVIFWQFRSIRSGQDIHNVFASDDSGALVGLQESFVEKVNQRIEDVRAEKGSVVVAGVPSNNIKFQKRN